MESKKCCSPVTCCGMPVEKGCYIFSIINAVLCSLSLLSSLGLLVYLMLIWLYGTVTDDSVLESMLWVFMGVCVASCVGFTIALVFAIVLCVGVSKNKPRYIMVFLVYSIVAIILSVLGTLGFLLMSAWGEVQVMIYASIPIGICVIYSVMLLLVYQTYDVLSTRAPVTTHRRLLNIDC